MLHIFRKIFSWFFTQKKTTKSFSDSTLKNFEHEVPTLIDTKELEVELDILNQAKRLGENNIPETQSLHLSGPEAKIINEIEEYRTKYANWRDSTLHLQNQNIAKLVLDCKTQVAEAKGFPKIFEQQINALLGQTHSQFDTLAKKYQAAKDEFNLFKQKNKLTREARINSKAQNFLGWSILFIFILIEGLANAYFFAQGNDNGLIGGFIAAGLCAGLNVFSAFFQGRYTVPFINHRNFLLKLFGLIAILTALSCLLAMALGIAHFREALGTEQLFPSKYALQTLKSSPFELQDLNSWVLCGITFLFGIFALFDGYKMNDPYPFYAKQSSRFEVVREEYLDEIDALQEELQDLKEKAIQQLDQYCEELKSNLVRQNKIINDKNLTQSIYDNYMKQTVHTAKALINTFRTENQLHRTTDSPRYFIDDVNLKEIVLQIDVPQLELSINKDRRNLDDCETQYNQFERELDNYKLKISTYYNYQYDHLTTLHQNI